MPRQCRQIRVSLSRRPDAVTPISTVSRVERLPVAAGALPVTDVGAELRTDRRRFVAGDDQHG